MRATLLAALFGLIATFPASGAPDRSRLWLLYALIVTYAASVVVRVS